MQRLWQRFKSHFNLIPKRTTRRVQNADYPVLNILFITPYPLYPIYTGGATRTIAKIKYFGSRHKLVVVSFYNSFIQKMKIKKILAPHCEKLILVKRGRPYMGIHPESPDRVLQFTTRSMWETLKRMSVNNYHLVIFEYIFTAEYRHLFKYSFTIIDEQNIESVVFKQYAQHEIKQENNMVLNKNNCANNSFRQAKLLERYENDNWPLFDLRTTVSKFDHDLMKIRCSKEILIVENGVNTKDIVPIEYQSDGKVLFMGHLSYFPNVQGVMYFLRDILPVLLDHDPDLLFCIAGRDASAKVLTLSGSKNVEFITDPEDMSPVARQCSVSVVPLFMGSGTRVKILYSMALGLPVVSTSQGCEGLSVIDGEHLLIRDEPESFAKAVIELREDRQLNEKLRKNGRLLVEQKYDWEKIFSNYENQLLYRAQVS